jgi:hypothetical protein
MLWFVLVNLSHDVDVCALCGRAVSCRVCAGVIASRFGPLLVRRIVRDSVGNRFKPAVRFWAEPNRFGGLVWPGGLSGLGGSVYPVWHRVKPRHRLPPLAYRFTMGLASDLFTVVLRDGVQKRQCNACKNLYGIGTGNGTLKTHYESKHFFTLTRYLRAEAAVEAPLIDSISDSSLSVVSASPARAPAAAAAANPLKRSFSAVTVHSGDSKHTQQTITQGFIAPNNQALHKATAPFFATNHIAYNIADSASFRTFVAAVRSSSKPAPNRKAIKRSITELAGSIKNEVLTGLTTSTTPVTVAIDGWTDVTQTKVTNVVLINSGVAYYWCSIPNAYAKNDAAWLYKELQPRLLELIEVGVRFAALVADNESVNNALFNLLTPSFPFLIRVPCAAHTIQLVVHQVMLIPGFRSTLAVVKDIISRFATQKDARLTLRTLQKGVRAHQAVRHTVGQYPTLMSTPPDAASIRQPHRPSGGLILDDARFIYCLPRPIPSRNGRRST